MGWELIVCVVVFIVIGAVAKKYGMNRSYTAGKHLFKNSDGNLEENKKKDFSDQNYYDNKGILK